MRLVCVNHERTKIFKIAPMRVFTRAALRIEAISAINARNRVLRNPRKNREEWLLIPTSKWCCQWWRFSDVKAQNTFRLNIFHPQPFSLLHKPFKTYFKNHRVVIDNTRAGPKSMESNSSTTWIPKNSQTPIWASLLSIVSTSVIITFFCC